MAEQPAYRAETVPQPSPAETSATQTPALVFSVKAVYTADEVRIVPRGELDIAARPQLERLVDGLRFESLRRVVVDLRPLDFIDSTGVAFVIDLSTAAREHGTPVAFVRGPAAVHRVLAVSGIDHALTFIDELG